MIEKMMTNVGVTEGTVSFKHTTLPEECWTWYQVHGDIKRSPHRPLVVLHGGPGSTHDYLLSLTDLSEIHGIPVIFYDQLGSGNSTHLREKRLDESFWTSDLFIAQLENLLQHLGIANEFDLLGQSWGGMLSATFASRGHPGLRRLVISNSPASLKLWLKACNEYRRQLPNNINDTLEAHERARSFDNQDYKDACMVWYKRHMCRLDPWPDYVLRSFELMEEDDTVYFTMNGPSEFTVIGSLRTFGLEEKLKNILVPTLVLNGEFDSADADAIAPFVRGIKNVRSHTFLECSHMCHAEDREGYMEVVSEFLKEKAV